MLFFIFFKYFLLNNLEITQLEYINSFKFLKDLKI